ncbi:MAG: hypothetical protein K8R79_08335, partial [Calditrichales bacterium]|nr:hypothetical protein [Calditrichales bacterium]
MLNSKHKILYICIIILTGIFSELSAQTSQWKLVWDKNSESNMSHYLVFRDTKSLPVVQVGQVIHPDTIYIDYTDKDIERGILYFYRLKAVNSDSLESDYSDEVSAALPKIEFPDSVRNRVLPPDSTDEINLDNYVTDPDNPSNQLTWAVEGNVKLSVQINPVSHIATISSTGDWGNQEKLIFTVTDADSFFDVGTITVCSDSSLIPAPNTNAGINAYPIPYRPAQHNNGITFLDIPENST